MRPGKQIDRDQSMNYYWETDERTDFLAVAKTLAT